MVAHGSLLNEGDVEAIKKPVLFLYSANDRMIPDDVREKYQAILKTKSFPAEGVYYPDQACFSPPTIFYNSPKHASQVPPWVSSCKTGLLHMLASRCFRLHVWRDASLRGEAGPDAGMYWWQGIPDQSGGNWHQISWKQQCRLLTGLRRFAGAWVDSAGR